MISNWDVGGGGDEQLWAVKVQDDSVYSGSRIGVKGGPTRIYIHRPWETTR